MVIFLFFLLINSLTVVGDYSLGFHVFHEIMEVILEENIFVYID